MPTNINTLKSGLGVPNHAGDRETIAVGVAVATPDAAKLVGCSSIRLTIETAPIRYTTQGTDPDNGPPTVGAVLQVTQSIELTGSEMMNLKMTRSGAADASVEVAYLP